MKIVKWYCVTANELIMLKGFFFFPVFGDDLTIFNFMQIYFCLILNVKELVIHFLFDELRDFSSNIILSL